MKKGYWLWHYGDYELFHIMSLHLRREERGYIRPAVWKLQGPYMNVKFVRRIECEKGYLFCHINGGGNISVNNKRYPSDTYITLEKGAYEVEIHVSNNIGLPAIYIESDVCDCDGKWLCNHFAGELTSAAYKSYFNSLDKNPEVFPFAYERKEPVTVRKTDEGTLYDFGTELFAYLNIANADKDKRIELYYGESEEEALDTAYSYITDCVCGKTEYKLRQRAFRYVYIIADADGMQVSADYEYLPFTEKGCFSCDNKLFERICAVAKYTFHLNCREGFLDGIKRDRWVWSGDAYQSARINRYLFADKEIEQRTLIGLVGREPVEQHINTIVDYSLLWFITLYEHYMTYGDKEFLRKIYPMAVKLMEFCEGRINADGFIEGVPGDWTFIDWSEIDKVGAVCAEQMLLIKAYSVMAEFAEILKLGESDYVEKSRKLKKLVNEYYWNEEKGAFIDSYSSGRKNVTRHANIFAVMYDIADEKQKQSILENVLKNESVTKITTPYFEGYELDALAKLGELSAVERMVADYWGGMLDLGATTVWEEYNPDQNGAEHYGMYGDKYGKSLCHAWGAGPIYLFGRYYLGVYATSAGYDTFVVEPKLGGLKQIIGKVPVGDGTVSVELDEKQLKVTSTKAGGTLKWNGKKYELKLNEAVVIEV